VALESMRRDAAAEPGSVGARIAHTETPGGPVLGQWASKVGICFQILSDIDSSAGIGMSF
jgi:hypothetical protein